MRSRIADVPSISHGHAFLPRQEAQGAAAIQPETRACSFQRWKGYGPSAVGKRLSYVLQDTDSQQARAYDIFFALPGIAA